MKTVKGSKYCESLFGFKRLQTIEVRIGNLPLGGSNPIRIQSMTTTDTMDTSGTVEQVIRMVDAGCEYVRITAPSKKEAENLQQIKDELRKRGYTVPLIADIHYTPNAAEIAARIVEKVRVNPGNYADKKRFDVIEYTDAQYESELQRIYERFSPLVKICREEGTAMRIGTNHGSLSDRIMSRYGDTPLGMVESALEFLRICEDHNYDQVVLSMKASNPQVMVQAYRLLAEKMIERGQVYPLHLGVTEAGDGEDGRIKSALGISSLLMDGLGDTVRVSLTEEPEYEAPVAQFLVDMYDAGKRSLPEAKADGPEAGADPYSFSRRETAAVGLAGGGQPPVVIAAREALTHRDQLVASGYTYQPALDKFDFTDSAADFLFLQRPAVFGLPGTLRQVLPEKEWSGLRNKDGIYSVFGDIKYFNAADKQHKSLNFIHSDLNEVKNTIHPPAASAIIILDDHSGNPWEWRECIYTMIQKGWKNPVILKISSPETFTFYNDVNVPVRFRMDERSKRYLWYASMVSSLMVDGLVDGLWLEPSDETAIRAAFGILQAARLRITKTEYISCPSCGRTLFDLQETTAKIRSRTSHLKGVKIGIMGCIVNGPGEMADADYGYVGVGVGKIALYRGKEVVEKSVKTDFAVDKLIDLIREDGNWVEP